MRSLRLTAFGSLEVHVQDDPVPSPGEVVLQVLACGLCGTDRHILAGEYPAHLPLVLGHEFGGRVIASQASNFEIGDLVSVDPNISCGDCADCRAGRVALCPSRIAYGVDIDGGLAERVAVRASQLTAMTGTVPAHALAFVEPLACCLRGLDLADISGGERVAVLGGGVMGQLMVQLAATAGAGEITMVTRQAARRDLACSLGASHAVTPEVADTQLGRSFDLVFECAGVIDTFQQSQVLARRGGSIILLGIPPAEAEAAVRPFSLVYDELRIQGSFLNPLTQGRAAELICSRSIDVDPLASRVVGLADAVQVLASPPRPGEVKVIVDPSR
ncbi:MAG: alcohol dehydrogenase catalytic domain-containing protein [Actinomycetales bacterium]